VNELEACVAGVVWRDGPISAYGVRERFRSSMTTAWSSSAGTIYPVTQRLLNAGLISAEDRRDARGTQLLTINTAGKQAVYEWMMAISPEIAAPVPDPIRTRLQYTSMLEPEDAERFLCASISATEAALAAVEASLARRREANWLDFLATLGSVAQLRGRLDWLRTVRDQYPGFSPGNDRKA
jgi:DNA-binding PadR family transcriptional regulator